MEKQDPTSEVLNLKQEQEHHEEEEEEHEQEEEDEEATLVVRKSITLKNDIESMEINAAVEANSCSDIEQEIVEPETIITNGGTKHEDLMINGNGTETINGGGEHKSENLVFYDKDEGVKSASSEHYVEKRQIVNDPRPDKENRHSSYGYAAEQDSTSAATNKREAEDLGSENISNSKPQSSEISVEESSTTYPTSKEIESVENDLINDDLLDETDYDVEGVLQKQNTHDLYCPNCKSCITRRVILRKRKRRIRISDEEVKRNKVEEATILLGSKIDAGSIHRPGEVSTDDNQEPTVDDDDDRERRPFIFKCLSCFSFFIPTGNGFKLFQKSGEKIVKQTVQGQQPSDIKKNWFTSMFQGQQTSTSANVGDQSGHPPSSQNARPTTHASNEFSGAAVSSVNSVVDDKRLPLLGKTSSFDGKGKLSSGNKLDTTKVKRIDVTVGQFESYTSDQLYESKIRNQVRGNLENNSSIATSPRSSLVTNGESEADAIGGLKLLISSDKGSSAISTLEDSQKTNMTSKLGETDKEAILFPTSISVHRGSDADGKLNISVAVPEEQQQDFRATIITESIFDNNNAILKDSNDGLAHHSEASQHITTKTQFEVHSGETLKVESTSAITNASAAQGKDTLITIDAHPSQPMQGIIVSPETSKQLATQVSTTGRRERSDQSRDEFQIEVIKSIVYGGLAESITSLSVVSSAAGGDAKTLNILALGMANLIGGLLILCHNIWELRSDRIVEVSNQVSDIQVPQRKDRYRELLGRRENFILHFVVSLLSYLVFGSVAPIVYGFSFRKSDDKEFKLLVVAASSLVCICILAIGRAYVQRPPKPYLKSITTFVILGFMVSGVSYAAGVLVEKLLEKLGLFDSGSVANLLMPETVVTGKQTWASY